MPRQLAAQSPQESNMPLLDLSSLVDKVAGEFGYNKPGTTFTPDNVAKLVHQESANKNEPPNKYGYAGYFQMKPSEFGLTPRDFANMSFEDQLRLYAGKYLPKYKYTGTEDLGVLNAAPAYANKPDDFVAYRAGSKEALANPQWVKHSNANGAVTVGGIKAWAQGGAAPDASGNPLKAAPANPYGPVFNEAFGHAGPQPLPAYPFSPTAQAQPAQPDDGGRARTANTLNNLLSIAAQGAPPQPQAQPLQIPQAQFSLNRSLGIPTLF